MTTFTAPGRPIVNSSLTDAEAVTILRNIPNRSSFADSLLQNVHRLTDKQRYWLHKLAAEYSAPKPAAVTIGGYAAIATLFATAGQHLKYPKITLATDDQGGTVVLSVAGPRSKNPGSINVASSRRYGEGMFYGRISKEGEYFPTGHSTTAVTELLARFAADPAGVASEMGHLTGCCVFCTIALEDERSLAVGYGPVCAEHYNLPWGNKRTGH